MGVGGRRSQLVDPVWLYRSAMNAHRSEDAPHNMGKAEELVNELLASEFGTPQRKAIVALAEIIDTLSDAVDAMRGFGGGG